MLFGPLVLFPQVLTAHGGGVVQAGLLLTALPAGFGLAAVTADQILPARWPNQRRCAGRRAAGQRLRCRAGDPRPGSRDSGWLGLLGAGLGIYIPANNAAIMAAVPPAAGGRHGRDGEHGPRPRHRPRGDGGDPGAARRTRGSGHPGAGPAVAMAALACRRPGGNLGQQVAGQGASDGVVRRPGRGGAR